MTMRPPLPPNSPKLIPSARIREKIHPRALPSAAGVDAPVFGVAWIPAAGWNDSSNTFRSLGLVPRPLHCLSSVGNYPEVSVVEHREYPRTYVCSSVSRFPTPIDTRQKSAGTPTLSRASKP